MKSFGLLLGVWILSTACAPAQVTVGIMLDQDQFLAGESLRVAVCVTNRSGQTLHPGEPGWLRFSVESHEGVVVAKKSEVPVEEAFTLESSKRATVRADLEPYFNIRTPGRYTIVATVTIKEWNRQFKSEPKPFEIIQGSKLWEQEVGLPKAPGATNQVPEMRRYTLHEANYLRKQLMLYVQVTGASGKIYKVFPIGPMLSFGQPEAQVDKLSNLHVLYQDGPHSFNYTAVDPDGNVFLRQSYDYTTRPQLKVDRDGSFKVVGGVRRIKSSDLPAPRTDENAQSPPP